MQDEAIVIKNTDIIISTIGYVKIDSVGNFSTSEYVSTNVIL